MSKSGELRLSDVRKVFRLVGECRELGRHEEQWRRHSNEGIANLLAARASNGGQINWAGPHGIIHFETPIVTGFSGPEAAIFAPFMRKRDPSQDPIFANLGRVCGRVVTRCRHELVEDTAWYGSISFNNYRRVVGVDHCIYTLCKLQQTNAYSLIGLHRAVGDIAFSAREARLLHLFHEELGGLIGAVLVCDSQVGHLSPRLRQTLDCLLNGDSEKQVAIHLGLSAPTVHQYVTALYRKFGVSSRGELLANFIRQPSPPMR
jgi:DNA-binding CsgD family transcriptional regulator